MKIVHVIHCCSSGGAEVLAKNILRQIKKIDNDFDIELWAIYKAETLFNGDYDAIEFEKNFVKDLNKVGIKVRFIDKKKNLLSRINVILNIKKLYNSFKPSLIHCHLESVTFHVVSSLMFKDVKIIETIHNIKINREKVHKFYLNRRVDKFISISKKVTDVINEQLGIDKNNIELIYNGIEIDKFKDKNNFSDRVEKILAVGRLTEQKDHMTLIKAFEIVRQLCIEDGIGIPKLEIVGDGNLKKQLIEYKNAKKLDEVQFLGIVNNVEDLFKNHQIYVMSSIYEGLSLSLIEASVSGISVVCTNVGSNNEIIKDNHNGIIVNSKDYEALANKMYMLIKNKNIRKKFFDNSKGYGDEFSIRRCAQNHMEFYKSIVK
ncbi:glycosyltransferase [Paraclostridium sordellii]|uniref:glycosyltransferase n=1 Tax=Paraclostridium sordellii TaxID=1505 RepID=UPI00096A87DD|nr:glycosyltransferase [Paeniclostridium sordellii]